MSCTCQNCGSSYKVDILVPDELWGRIKPVGVLDGAGLMCGSCIAKRLEIVCGYSVFKLDELKGEGR